VNLSQTLGVIELSEQTVIDQIVTRLTHRYPTISESTVANVVHDVHARYEGRPLRDFVPLFVERNAKSALEELGVRSG
jgi:hypothetical protein